MNCKMEENSRLYDVLSVLEDGYTTGNFEGLFRLQILRKTHSSAVRLCYLMM